MSARAMQSYMRPLTAAIAIGDTTPVADTGAVAWSTTANTFLRWSGTAWAGMSGGGASSSTLATATYTTATLGAGASETGTVTLAVGYRLVDVQTSQAARVRLYTTAVKRSSDASRAIGTDPGYNAGVALDLVTTDNTVYNLAPTVAAYNRETTPSAAIPLSVTAIAAGAVTVTFTYGAL